jgi:hypothetical protein
MEAIEKGYLCREEEYEATIEVIRVAAKRQDVNLGNIK